MKRNFILLVMLFVCWSLFAEGNPATLLPHTCDDYLNQPSNFIPSWFEHLEFADKEGLDYGKDFLQEHGGRVGRLVYQYQKNDLPSDWTYNTHCSGTLIGERYFLTAGHCATTKDEYGNDIKIVGVLFGYQMADIYDDNNKTPPNYPRVSLYDGYLDNNGNFRQYGLGGYSNFKKHHAYFPIVDYYTRCNDNGAIEHGWKHICPNKDDEENDAEYDDDDNDNEHDDSDIEYPLAENIPWPDATGQALGKMDYAIYQLRINSNDKLPFEEDDPWPWVSVNNQDDGRPDEPWRLLDNTNGKRGWARVNTAVLQTNSEINIIGHPNVAKMYVGNKELSGLKIVNVGSVVDGKGFAHAAHFDEDLLIFERADIWSGNSGSSVLDNHGKLAGLVSWFGCIPGLPNDAPYLYLPSINPTEPINPIQANATNYATPMWKICRASQIIKNAAKDMDCNGVIDWWDFVFSAEIELAQSINVVIDFNFIKIKNLEIPTTVEEIHIRRYDMDQKKVVTETREIPAYTYQLAIKDNGDLFYVALQNNAFYLFKNGTSLGLISNYPQLNGSSALVKGDDIYFAGGNFANMIPMLPGSGNNAVQYITKISSDGQNGYNFSGVATIPTHLEDIRIFALGNDIYVSGNTTTNFVVYKLVADNQSESGYSLSVINASQPVRKDYNLTASEGKIIVSGGATDYISTVLNLDEEDYPSTFSVYGNIIMLEPAVSNNWVTVAENINDKIIMFSVTAIDNGSFVIVNPFITVGNSMQKFVLNLSDIPINNETIRVSFESHPLTFCLGESENTLQSGLGTSGECVLFTHPWYNSFSAGATVYSLDGKGERLYVGTNNAIKIYDISDPISPVLVSSFSTSSRVNDLEVYGDTLFAATNGGLYKLDASDPDELTQILFISATLNYQYKVEVYNGKLYVGDDNGIKIRDLETLSVLTSVNNGSVLDFAIENGEIGLYKDALFSPVEIRDAETLTLKANEFFGCFEIEVGSSDGSFYLSCDDETYRFEDDGDGDISFTELSGDIRELQDVYTYNGYSYMYDDENTIWISTSNDVPALCGNGIVEGDEVCDGAPIECTELDSNYVSGTATCNATCDGYNTSNCSDDGW